MRDAALFKATIGRVERVMNSDRRNAENFQFLIKILVDIFPI
jgi:hypothetical protein